MSQDADTTASANADNTETPNEEDGLPPHVEALERRLDALSTQVHDLREEVQEARQQRDDLRDEVEALREENTALRQDLERLDARTDLLELVEAADSMSGEQRSVALIQHLKRAAEQQRERGGLARASVNRDEAEAVLHHPDVDRTSIYDDMRRAVRLVGNQDVLWYDSDTGGGSRLKLDLETGVLPSKVVGQTGNHGGR